MISLRARLAAAHTQHDEIRPGTAVFTSQRLLPGYRWLLVPLLLLFLPLLLWQPPVRAKSAVLLTALASSRALEIAAGALLLFTVSVLLFACRAVAKAAPQAGAGAVDGIDGEQKLAETC